MKAQIIHLNKYLNVFNQAVNLKNKIRKMKSCRYRTTHGKYYNVNVGHILHFAKNEWEQHRFQSKHSLLPIVYSVSVIIVDLTEI